LSFFDSDASSMFLSFSIIFTLSFVSPSSIWIMPWRCYSWHIYLISCFATWNLAFYWNCPRRWLVSICIVCSTFRNHSMLKLYPWIMHRLWRQMQAITTLGIFHNGISNLFSRIFHRPLKTPKALSTNI
jgi:hypothetical protein